MASREPPGDRSYSTRWWLGWFAAAFALNLLLDLALDPPLLLRWATVLAVVVGGMLLVVAWQRRSNA